MPPVLLRLLTPAGVAASLFLLGAIFAVSDIWPDLHRLSGGGAQYDVERLMLLYSTLPRMVTALVAGAALALAGALLQQALRNPLASPSTLGISAGANLAVAATMFAFPTLEGISRDVVAMAGSALAALAVFSIGARRGFSPLSLVLAGLMIGIWCAAASAILVLLNERYLSGLFIWGAGSLSLQSWAVPVTLFPKILVLTALAGLIMRPLSLMELGDVSAGALGLSVVRLRVLAVSIAVSLAALVTSAVGVIGFVGLVAPAIARLAGARRIAQQILWSPLIGAGLLLLTDEIVKRLSDITGGLIPTGAMTALFGAPLVLFLLPRLKATQRELPAPPPGIVKQRRVSPIMVLSFVGLLVAGVTAAILFGRAPDGSWGLLPVGEWREILPYRWPRVVAAFAAGSLLGAAGAILQRLTGNEIASPEVLGVSAGATLGMAVALFAFTASGPMLQLGFASAGAAAVLFAILSLGLRSGFTPERVLLTGVVLTAMLDAVIGVLAAGGDPRAMMIIRWMGGSTYLVDGFTARIAALCAVVFATMAILAHRWLTLLPLGAGAARELGVHVPSARAALFILAAAMTAAATLTIGPLSFAGLMGPHLAREIGFRRAGPHLIAAALAAGCLMVLADWVGRMAAFPYQLPAGLVSALVGAPLLMVLLGRRK
jgi:ferric hydroxamate transport system permease protein